MPRKIIETALLDDIEDDIIITIASLKADPDARDLVEMTNKWFASVDATRAKDREARIAIGEAAALRTIANGRLDDECRSFGDNLNLAVKKDRTSARWKRFFTHTVGDFVKQRLASQVAAVRAWLLVTPDDVLDRHRPALDQWSATAQTALDQTAASAQVRGAAHLAREALAEDLTRERDGLEAALVARAKERGLARDWPSRFFRVIARTTPAAATAPSPPEGTDAPSTV